MTTPGALTPGDLAPREICSRGGQLGTPTWDLGHPPGMQHTTWDTHLGLGRDLGHPPECANLLDQDNLGHPRGDLGQSVTLRLRTEHGSEKTYCRIRN